MRKNLLNSKVFKPSSVEPVVAMVDKDDSQEPVELLLSDIGIGPDKVADDGVYASYFTMFTESNKRNRYTLKCLVEGTEDLSTQGGSTGDWLYASQMQTPGTASGAVLRTRRT